MISKYIFIDTQAYEAERYNFDGEALGMIVELCKSGAIQLVVTESVIGEVKAHFAESVDKVVSSIGAVRNECKLIQHVADMVLEKYATPPDKDSLLSHIFEKWNYFLRITDAVIISSSNIDASDLLDMYFTSSPPFRGGKKKHEFPDAISALSLEWWMSENNTSIVIIAQDGDFDAWASSRQDVDRVKTIKEYINLYNEEFDAQTGVVHRLIAENDDMFCIAINNYFSDCHFDIDDMSEASTTGVECVHVMIEDAELIRIDDDIAVVSIDFEVEFSAGIEFPNYEKGVYDQEEGRYLFLPYENIEKEFSKNYGIIVKFKFDSKEGAVKEIVDVYFEDGPYVYLSIDC